MENRSVVDIIDELLKIIPDNEEKLIKKIKEYSDTLWNQAPELKRGHCWIPLQQIMNNNIIEIDTDWKKKTVMLFNNESYPKDILDEVISQPVELIPQPVELIPQPDEIIISPLIQF